MNMKFLESSFILLISIFVFCFSCQVPQSSVSSRKVTDKTADSFLSGSYEDSLFYGFDSFIRGFGLELDESELEYPMKEVTLDFSAYDKYHVETTDPKLFATSNTEVIDLALIGDDYSLPMKTPRVVSRYAGRRVNHTGIDLVGRGKDPIYATFDGVVRVAKWSSTYGNVIVVRHYNGLETVYSHNTKNLVKVGEEVKTGQQIAVSGMTGRASGDHLHFEVRINGQHFNPELLFDFKTRELRRKSLFCYKHKKKIEVSLVDPFPYHLSSAKHSPKNAFLFDMTERKYMM